MEFWMVIRLSIILTAIFALTSAKTNVANAFNLFAQESGPRAKFSKSYSAGTGLRSVRPSAQSGIASIYGYRGGRTANGERAHPAGLTAAHRSLPFGTMVRVTNRRNNRSVVVRINDRGPFVHGRVIDVTPAAARALGFSGLTTVTLNVVGG
jgi:rare lipoprotein A